MPKGFYRTTLTFACLLAISIAAYANPLSPKSLVDRELEQEHPQEALKLLEKYAHSFPPFELHRMKGQTYAQMGNYEKATSELTKCLDEKPNDNHLRYTRASLFRAQKKYKEALSDCNYLLEKNINPTERLRERASIYVDLMRYDDALADLKRAANIAPHGEGLGALRDALCLAQKTNKNREAIELATAIIKQTPEEESAYLSRAKSYMVLGNYGAARNDFDVVLKSSDIDRDARADIIELRSKCIEHLSRDQSAPAGALAR